MADLFYPMEQHQEDLTSYAPDTRETQYDLASPTGQQQQQAPAQAATPQGETQAQQPIAPLSSFQAPESGQLSISDYKPLDIQGEYAKLYNPIQSKIQTGYGELGESVSAFNKAVGYPRSWATLGGEKTLEAGLAPKATTADKTAARGLVTAGQDYTIPEFQLQDIPTITEELAGKNLDTFAGTKDLLSQYYTGLTRGELGGQSERFRRDPEFQNISRSVEQAIHDYYNQYQRALGESGALGVKRAKEEQDISEQAKNYLTGQQTGLLGGLEKKVTGAKEELAKRKEALAGITDYASLLNLPKEYLGFEPGKVFETEAKYKEAKKAYEDVMAKYPDLKDVPNMVPGKTGHGINTLVFPEEWWKANQGKYTADQMATLKKQARARQKELEETGFSPFAEHYGYERYHGAGKIFMPVGPDEMGTGEWLNQAPTIPVGAGETWNVPDKSFGHDELYYRGKYSDLIPVGLQGMNEWAPMDLRNFLNMTNIEPTVGNVITPEEIARYNAIQEMQYGQGAAPWVTETPWEGPNIQANADAYRAAMEEAMKERGMDYSKALLDLAATQEWPADPGLIEQIMTPDMLTRYGIEMPMMMTQIPGMEELLELLRVSGKGGPMKLKQTRVPEVW